MPFPIRLHCLLLALGLVLGIQAPQAVAEKPFLPKGKRILFLGDSITQAGTYVEYFEAYLFTHYPDRQFEVINAGLASETASGLSEPNHAGGKFPRPWIHERLERVLEKTKPDLVFACYGMNDGIYLPLEDERFAKFQKGITLLHENVVATGARIIHLTPPIYEAPASGPAATYDKTLEAYSKWLLDQRAKGWEVLDIQGPMRQAYNEGKAKDPGFHFTGDHIHPGPQGHWVMTKALLDGLGFSTENFTANPDYAPLLKLVHQRGQLLLFAWLGETGHKRPGVPKGLPLEEAQTKAKELETQIRAVAAALPKK